MIYFIQSDGGPIKIGWCGSEAAFKTRLAALQTGNHATLTVRATSPGSKQAEDRLHVWFGAERVRGEWFEPCEDLLRATESDESAEDLIGTINAITQCPSCQERQERQIA